MKKKMMAMLLSATMILGTGSPFSIYGEDFSSGEAVENAKEWNESVPEEIQEGATDDPEEVYDAAVPEHKDGETVEDAGEPDILTGEESAPDDESEFSDTVDSEDLQIDSLGSDTTGFDTARSISVNSTYATNFTDVHSEKWYKIYVPQNGAIWVDAEHQYIESGSEYWYIDIYNNGNHEELASYGFCGNKISYSQQRFGIAAGTYYVKVYTRYSVSNTPFRFKINYTVANNWETELNDTYQTADYINVNTQYYGNIQLRDDTDWYKFTIPYDGAIFLNFTHDYREDSAIFWKVDLYNGNYSEMETYSFRGNVISSDSYQIGVPAGTYYLKIHRQYFHMDLEYGLKVNYSASNVWEKEFNDSYSTATPIVLNTTYIGSIQGNRSDADWYKLTVPASGTYHFSFAHEYIENGGKFWEVIFYDSSFKEKSFSYYLGEDKTDGVNVELDSAGVYYIKITDSWNQSCMPYYFSVTPHIHSYTYDITPATTSENGSITPKCSCGYKGTKITIYRAASTYISNTKYTYNGRPCRPSVVVYDSKNNVISDNYYTLTYDSNSKSVGSHKVIIRFKGNYSGTVTREYDVFPKTVKITKVKAASRGFTVKWKKGSDITGYQIQYATNKKFSRASSWTISRKNTTSVKLRGLRGRKKYYVRIRTYKVTSGYRYYSSWSSAKAVKTKR